MKNAKIFALSEWGLNRRLLTHEAVAKSFRHWGVREASQV